MRPDLIVIEQHENDGVRWILSTCGSNPPADECLEVSSKEEAFSIKAAYDSGDIMPFLRASGAA